MKKIFLNGLLLHWLLIVLISCRKDKITGATSPVLAVTELKKLWAGAPVQLNETVLDGANALAGIVISNPTSGNSPSGTVIVQSYKRKILSGIAIVIGGSASNYLPGDSVYVNIAGGTLERPKGFLQISGLAASAIKKISQNNSQKINLVTTTFNKVTDNMDIYESTLVQLKSAVVNNPQTGLTYSGDVDISDWANVITMHTEATASFASSVIPDMADYIGIPLLLTSGAKSKASLWIRNTTDVVAQQLEPHKPGLLYANFPEGWEHPVVTKTSNSDGVAVLPTGEWQMNGMYIITSANIKVAKHETWTLMMQKGKDCSLEMNFNLPYGASKFSFYYGAPVPTSDGATQLRAEYSQDSGLTWTALGLDLKVTDVNTFYYQEYILNLKGPVRFRIHKLSGGAFIDLGRLSVDDIAIYQN